jgi:hypothetical protein
MDTQKIEHTSFTAYMYARHAYMRSGSLVFPCSSRAGIAYKYKQMKNVHVVSRPEFHALSNAALVFAVSLI